MKCAGGKLVVLLTGILGVGGGERVLTELNQLLTSTGGGGRMVDLGCRRSLSLGWVVDFGYRRSFGL